MILKNVIYLIILLSVMFVFGSTGLCREDSSIQEINRSGHQTMKHSCENSTQAKQINHNKTTGHRNNCDTSKICCNDIFMDSKYVLFSTKTQIESILATHTLNTISLKLPLHQHSNRPPPSISSLTPPIFLLHCTFLI